MARKFVSFDPTPPRLISALQTILAEVSSIIASIGHTHGHVRACVCSVSHPHASPKGKWKKKLLVKDAIADIALQQVLTRPEGEYCALALARECVQGYERVVGNHVWVRVLVDLSRGMQTLTS